jgi:uncharacterized protein with von Willebrand factor type A (vWA) domain
MATSPSSPQIDRQDSRLADNIVYFARTLRKAGLRVGPAAVKDAIEAVLAAGIGSRDDFYWTLHSVLIARREDHATFDEAFRLYWRSREHIEKMLAMFSSIAAGRERARPKAAEAHGARARFESNARNGPHDRPAGNDPDARFSFSGKEVLRSKDFAQMTADELVQARRAMDQLALPVDKVATRRFRSDTQGRRIDPRAMMRSSLKTGGDLILPKFRSRREMHPPLVVLADISGSMSQYTRIFLHFMHAMMARRRRVHCFVFGTQLSNITRPLRYRNPDDAIAHCTGAVRDWSGGTRIGETLRDFNRNWSRRVLGQGAVVLLITDGLERGETGELEMEMERLTKSCRRLIWLNPLLRFEGFEPRAHGIRVMLPHVDDFRAVHNLDALEDLCRALSRPPEKSDNPKRWLQSAFPQPSLYA